MEVELVPGKYIIAVSGGVDSVVLLDLLVQKRRAYPATSKQYTYTVAHFDHGIRSDSEEDRLFVQGLAARYKLPFVFDEATLGPHTSEETARNARYQFLERARRSSGAQAIITAHHQDDALETAIFNVLRGTGRKGLSALSSTADIRRPLLKIPKGDIVTYAKFRGLTWHEDSTNSDQRYKRNYIRHSVLPRFTIESRQKLSELVERQRSLNEELDVQLINHLHLQSSAKKLDRKYFNQLPHSVAKELLAVWLRAHGIRQFDATTIERLTVAAKTARPGKQLAVLAGYSIIVNKTDLALTVLER
jgi:tRNA(Ile)-lysidine synthetase-like protein